MSLMNRNGAAGREAERAEGERSKAAGGSPSPHSPWTSPGFDDTLIYLLFRPLLTFPESAGINRHGEGEEVLLVDRAQHLDDGPLDDLVLQRGDGERSLPPVRLRDLDPARGVRSVRPATSSSNAR